MNNFSSFSPPPNYCRFNQMQESYKTLDEVLTLVKKAVQGELENELFYDHLISIAPTQEEKDMIAAIRDDQRKHNKYFREIYNYYTRQNIPVPVTTSFEKPKSYIEGITKAKFGELSAVERYRYIRAGLPTEYYKDMVFEILTDELKHVNKYDYILYLDSKNTRLSSVVTAEPLIPTEKKAFTLEEAQRIANIIGIDFSKEQFDLEQFRMGLDVELEHGIRNPITNVTSNDPILTGKIALAHLHEFPDYYTRLAKLEDEAKAFWAAQRGHFRQAREFTLSELNQYDGSMGKPAYVAVNGIVYDVSNALSWGGATHFGLQAGKDLTAEFQSCHGMAQILQKLPKVGTLKV